jgi:hypothetical protein
MMAKTELETEGLGQKYYVTRTDGRDIMGEKHHGCQYFVLDLTHDPVARDVAERYSRQIRSVDPQLAEDLHDLVIEIILGIAADEAPGMS